MKAARATVVSTHVLSESDSEEEIPLKRRPRVRSGGTVLAARDERLKAPSQGSLPPQRRAPPVPTAGLPPAQGRDEPMLAVGDIRLTTQPTAWPAPQRPAPPIPTASKPVPQAEVVVPKTPSPRLLERQRPAPISTVSTARPPVAEPADTEEWHTPLNSPSQLASPTLPTSPTSLSSVSVPSSPSSMSSPSWPATPVTGSPVVPRREGKQPMPPSPPASTSAAPQATGPALPSEPLPHLDKLAHVGELANQLAEPLDKLLGLQVPRLPPFQYMHRDALVDANRFLARHEHLLDMKELRDAQGGLRDLLDNGVQEGRLPGVSEARLGGLRALSEVDLMSLTQPLRQFKADYDDLYDVVVNVKGGDRNWFTRYARPVQEIEAKRAARIAEDNEALRLGHYTF